MKQFNKANEVDLDSLGVGEKIMIGTRLHKVIMLPLIGKALKIAGYTEPLAIRQPEGKAVASRGVTKTTHSRIEGQEG